VSLWPPGFLDRTLKAWRIGDPDGRYPIFDARGSVLVPGRWNDAQTPVIYASEHYSTALLEKLVHGSGQIPPGQHAVEITVPPGTSVETVTKDMLPDWAARDGAASRAFGANWVRECRSLVLIVPSVVAREDNNVVINPAHPDFGRIEVGRPRPVCWDHRLFD
jgi:RES domain-containing protein